MSPAEKFYQRGRAALLAGEVHRETPPVDGGQRWGISAILRPSGPIVADLLALGAEAAEVAGPGHWVHGAGTLHSTLRAFEIHSTRPSAGDERIAGYAAAIDDAAAGFAPVELDLIGPAPHSGGVMILGHCGPKGLPELHRRLVTALEDRGITDLETGFVRDFWYLTLLHFAAPVPAPAVLVAWADRRRDQRVGRVVYRSLELIRWRFIDGAIHPEVLHAATLDG